LTNVIRKACLSHPHAINGCLFEMSNRDLMRLNFFNCLTAQAHTILADVVVSFLLDFYNSLQNLWKGSINSRRRRNTVLLNVNGLRHQSIFFSHRLLQYSKLHVRFVCNRKCQYDLRETSISLNPYC